jgi:hypothetical protein
MLLPLRRQQHRAHTRTQVPIAASPPSPPPSPRFQTYKRTLRHACWLYFAGPAKMFPAVLAAIFNPCQLCPDPFQAGSLLPLPGRSRPAPPAWPPRGARAHRCPGLRTGAARDWLRPGLTAWPRIKRTGRAPDPPRSAGIRPGVSDPGARFASQAAMNLPYADQPIRLDLPAVLQPTRQRQNGGSRTSCCSGGRGATGRAGGSAVYRGLRTGESRRRSAGRS